jgi:chromosome segregation ATPase
MSTKHAGRTGLVLTLACFSVLAPAQTSNPKTARGKRVFTNDDLQKYSEKYGGDSSGSNNNVTQATSQSLNKSAGVTDNAQAKAEPGDRAYWISKLKEAEETLEKYNAAQTEYADALDKYQGKLLEAKTDFQINTARLQIADCEKNLARTKEGVKKAEEEKTKLLAEAEKKGFKPEDLIKAKSDAPAEKP